MEERVITAPDGDPPVRYSKEWSQELEEFHRLAKLALDSADFVRRVETLSLKDPEGEGHELDELYHKLRALDSDTLAALRGLLSHARQHREHRSGSGTSS